MEGLALQKKKSKASAAAHATRREPRIHAAKRQRRSADDILNRIVQAARAEFKRSGFAGTTTATIARRAEVTEAQLFRYFDSKATLFRETIFKPLEQQLLSFIDNHMPDVTSGTGFREMAGLYTSELQSFISENSEMLTSLVVAQTYDTGAGHGVGEINSLSTYFERGASVMSKRMKTRGKNAPKVEPKLMVRVSFAAVLGCIMFRDWIFPRGLATDEEIRSAINDFVLEGISAND